VTAPVPTRVSPDAEVGPSLSRLWWVTGPLLGLLAVALIAVSATPVPYLAFSPGGARSVEPLITVSRSAGGPAVKVDAADDDLLYVTVSVRTPVAIEALYDVLDDQVEVEPSKPYLGNQSNADNTRLNQELMTDSQDKARKVALEKLGYRVESTPRGAFFDDVDPTFPVAKVLKPGATVTEADGKPITNGNDLAKAIGAHRPGDMIRLVARPLGAPPETVTIKLNARADDPTKAQLGVSLSNAFTYRFPITIQIDTGKVGGPSAGLAFTLAILDRLTPGRLLGKQRVAVTGTIELDGSIGPVGGVDHKTEAAIREGASLFIVPPDEYPLARKTARGRLQVEQAQTLNEALAILRRHGGDPLPVRPSP
jgi:PDZ domain-containing protein